MLTTHYLDEAEALADRVAVIDKGALIGLDTPAALVRRYGRKQVRFKLGGALGRRTPVPCPLRCAELGATLDASGTPVVTCPADTTPVAEVLGLASLLSPDVIDVEIIQSSLEDVFLHLTGRPDAATGGQP